MPIRYFPVYTMDLYAVPACRYNLRPFGCLVLAIGVAAALTFTLRICGISDWQGYQYLVLNPLTYLLARHVPIPLNDCTTYVPLPPRRILSLVRIWLSPAPMFIALFFRVRAAIGSPTAAVAAAVQLVLTIFVLQALVQIWGIGSEFVGALDTYIRRDMFFFWL